MPVTLQIDDENKFYRGRVRLSEGEPGGELLPREALPQPRRERGGKRAAGSP